MTLLAIVAMLGLTAAPQQVTPVHPPQERRIAMTCFKTGEETAGMNKICYYNCLGSRAAITISAVALCPLTIDR